MTREETRALMAAIRAVYPKFCADDASRRAALELWAVALAELPAERARQALVEHLRASAFEPKPADLLRLGQPNRLEARPVPVFRHVCARLPGGEPLREQPEEPGERKEQKEPIWTE